MLRGFIKIFVEMLRKELKLFYLKCLIFQFIFFEVVRVVEVEWFVGFFVYDEFGQGFFNNWGKYEVVFVEICCDVEFVYFVYFFDGCVVIGGFCIKVILYFYDVYVFECRDYLGEVVVYIVKEVIGWCYVVSWFVFEVVVVYDVVLIGFLCYVNVIVFEGDDYWFYLVGFYGFSFYVLVFIWFYWDFYWYFCYFVYEWCLGVGCVDDFVCFYFFFCWL